MYWGCPKNMISFLGDGRLKMGPRVIYKSESFSLYSFENFET